MERQLTYPKDSPKDNDTYAQDDIDVEDGSTEDDIETKVSSERAQPVSIRRAVVERAVVESVLSI